MAGRRRYRSGFRTDGAPWCILAWRQGQTLNMREDRPRRWQHPKRVL